MDSTMQDFPLTVTGILRHGTTWYSGRKVITRTPDGYREISFGELGARVARLAHGLRQVGVTNGQRVATFMTNNQEHLEAYFAAPCMGAVLHTLNIRLAAEQIAFIANQAEDSVVLVDMSVAPAFAAVLPDLTTVHTVVAVGPGDLDLLTASGKQVIRYDDLLEAIRLSMRGPISMKRAPPQCVTPAEPPATPRALCTAIDRPICTRWPRAQRIRSASSRATVCYPSHRCSMPTPGVSPMRP